jgi:hypothetical protein
MIIARIILIIENSSGNNTRSLVTWSLNCMGRNVFSVDSLYSEFIDKLDLNITLPEDFPIYTYRFPDSFPTHHFIEGNLINMDIKTNINSGKIKLLFVCYGLIEYRSGVLKLST